MFKKSFIWSAFVALMFITVSCQKEESLQPSTNEVQNNSVTTSSNLKAASSGWVLQTWSFSYNFFTAYSTTKTFDVGNQGLIIGITNNSNNQIRVDWSTISPLADQINFAYFIVPAKGIVNKTLPVTLNVKKLKIDLSNFNGGSASGTFTVNSKY